MLQCRKSLLAVTLSAVALTGCLEEASQGGNDGAFQRVNNPNIQLGEGPVYDPVNQNFPLPEDTLFFLNEENDGTALNGTDPANPVTLGLGFLDGVSTLAPYDIEISTSLDTSVELDVRAFIEVQASNGNVTVPIQEVEEPGTGVVVPNPNQNVFLLPLEYAGGDSLKGAEGEVPGLSLANDFRRAQFLEERATGTDVEDAQDIYNRLLQSPPVRVEVIDINGGTNNAVRVLPESPLDPKTKYAIALSNDLRTSMGSPLVGSPAYQSISNPARVLGNPLFAAFRASAAPSRQQVTDFGQFKREFFSNNASSVPASIAGFDDVVYSATFTTTAIEDVLVANAAPESFFQEDLRVDLRRKQIGKLVSGFYNLTNQRIGTTTGDSTADERAINEAIFTRLTDNTFRLFDQELADRLITANENGEKLKYADVARDSNGNVNRRVAFATQLATAEAAVTVKSTDVDEEASSLAGMAAGLLDLPKSREVRIYRQRPGRQINPEFGQTASEETDPILGGTGLTDVDIQVYEGEIVLPYYMGIPEDDMDGVAITGSNWSAADFGSNVNLPLAITDRVTYRFPFAREVGEVKVPFILTMPQVVDTAQNNGAPFPVIIYQSALTQDRSAALTMALATGLFCNSSGNVQDCYATITLDQPLHGVFDGFEGATSDGEPTADGVGLVSVNDQCTMYPEGSRPSGCDINPDSPTVERHFGFTGDANLQPVPASEVEGQPESGNLFLNFANFANIQGNMRQATMDALNVNASLAAIEAEAGVDLDLNRVYYLTHSLSGMGGVPVPEITRQAIAAGNTELTPFLGQAFFNVPGHFTRALENSHDVSAALLPALFAASEGLLAQGRFELNAYLNILQGLVDGVDPANYGGSYAGTNTMLAAIVGDPADPEPYSECTSTEPNRVTTDCTVPVAADDTLFPLGPLERDVMLESGTVFNIDSLPAPIAGTEPLAKTAGAVNVFQATAGQPFISLFREGSHGNPISAGQAAADPGSSFRVFGTLAIQMMEIFQGNAPSSSGINLCDAEADGSEDCAAALVQDSERTSN